MSGRINLAGPESIARLFTAYQSGLTVAHHPVLSTQPRPGSGSVALILPLPKSLPPAIPTRPEPWRTRKNTGRSRLRVRQTAQRRSQLQEKRRSSRRLFAKRRNPQECRLILANSLRRHHRRLEPHTIFGSTSGRAEIEKHTSRPRPRADVSLRRTPATPQLIMCREAISAFDLHGESAHWDKTAQICTDYRGRSTFSTQMSTALAAKSSATTEMIWVVSEASCARIEQFTWVAFM